MEAVPAEQKTEPRHRYNLAVILKADKRLIGSVRIGILSEENREADLGYGIDPEYWGRGYATEAVGALIDFGFLELKLHRIVARCDRDNVASRRVMERLGMTREGLLRETRRLGEAWSSDYLYSILEQERGP